MEDIIQPQPQAEQQQDDVDQQPQQMNEVDNQSDNDSVVEQPIDLLDQAPQRRQKIQTKLEIIIEKFVNLKNDLPNKVNAITQIVHSKVQSIKLLPKQQKMIYGAVITSIILLIIAIYLVPSNTPVKINNQQTKFNQFQNIYVRSIDPQFHSLLQSSYISFEQNDFINGNLQQNKLTESFKESNILATNNVTEVMNILYRKRNHQLSQILSTEIDLEQQKIIDCQSAEITLNFTNNLIRLYLPVEFNKSAQMVNSIQNAHYLIQLYKGKDYDEQSTNCKRSLEALDHLMRTKESIYKSKDDAQLKKMKEALIDSNRKKDLADCLEYFEGNKEVEEEFFQTVKNIGKELQVNIIKILYSGQSSITSQDENFDLTVKLHNFYRNSSLNYNPLEELATLLHTNLYNHKSNITQNVQKGIFDFNEQYNYFYNLFQSDDLAVKTIDNLDQQKIEIINITNQCFIKLTDTITEALKNATTLNPEQVNRYFKIFEEWNEFYKRLIKITPQLKVLISQYEDYENTLKKQKSNIIQDYKQACDDTKLLLQQINDFDLKENDSKDLMRKIERLDKELILQSKLCQLDFIDQDHKDSYESNYKQLIKVLEQTNSKCLYEQNKLEESQEKKKIYSECLLKIYKFQQFKYDFNNTQSTKFQPIIDYFHWNLAELEAKARNKVPQLDVFVYYLVQLKDLELTIQIPEFQKIIKQSLKVLLYEDANNKIQQKSDWIVLSHLLQETENGIGEIIIQEYDILSSKQKQIHNSITPTNNIDHVVSNLQFSEETKSILKSRYLRFNETYIILINEILGNAKLYKNSHQYLMEKITENNIKNKDQELERYLNNMAYIFAMWSLQDTKQYISEAKLADANQEYQFKAPNPAQIVSIMIMIGLDQSSPSFEPNLIELKTGEGKSIVLAVTASILALEGYDVHVLCYSEYLTRRDEDSFTKLFNFLGVKKNIQYFTFKSLAKKYTESSESIKMQLRHYFYGEAYNENNEQIQLENENKILLIDEVDVFFNKQFLGQQFTQGDLLYDKLIEAILKRIYKDYYLDYFGYYLDFIKFWDQEPYKSYPEYQQLINKYKGWQPLIDNQFKQAYLTARNLKSKMSTIDYRTIGNFICEWEFDRYNCDKVNSYTTLFTYYISEQNGTIRYTNNNKQYFGSFSLYVGKYSFHQIPKNYKQIFGISGTLQQLNEDQRNFLKSEYNISKYTNIPSAFESKLKFDKTKDIVLTDNQFDRIIQEIQELGKNQTKRPIMIFFDTSYNLQSFKSHLNEKISNLKQIGYDLIIINEYEGEGDTNNQKVVSSTFLGKITLAMRQLGRGTDFKIFDRKVKEAGGPLVIMAYYSMDVSEELQIMGRASRYGDPGSFKMILSYDQCTRYLTKYTCSYGQAITELEKERQNIQSKEFKELAQKVIDKKEAHNAIQTFLKNIQSNNKEQVVETILKLNP